jgi:DNA-binding MarR family transcriptional regulator
MTKDRDRVDEIVEQWATQLPSLDVSPMAIIARISQLSRFFEREIDRTLSEFGLTESQFGVLAALRRAGRPYRLSPTKLYNSLLITSGAMTNRLERLAAAGLVRRVRDPEDGRSLLVELTPKGRRLVERSVQAHYAREAELIEALGQRDRENLVRGLRRLLRQFEHPPTPERRGC